MPDTPTHHEAGKDAAGEPPQPNDKLPAEPTIATGDSSRAERPDNGVVPPGDGATSRKV